MSLIAGQIRDELERAYGAPDRHYHNLSHLEALLGLMRTHAAALSDQASVETAIWFHDAVYDTHRQDNEEKSAELAAERLASLLSAEHIGRIGTMIRATAGHTVPDELEGGARLDCALFLDMDLAILGSASDEFAAYEAAVRREYDWVPDALWIEGRRKVLERFLARSTIYASPQFQASHEAAARRNLARSLEQFVRRP